MAKKIRLGQTAMDRDLKITTKLGEVKTFDNGKTYATISRLKADGTEKSAMEVLEEIMSRDNDPTVTQPSVSLAVSPNGTNVEVGETVNVSGTPTFNPGSYSFGPATGCTPTHTVKVKVNGVEKDSGTTTDKKAKTFSGVAAPEDGQTITVEVSTAYTQGAVPLTQLENEKASLRIAAGTKTATKTACTARRARFYGVIDTAAAPTTSAAIRALAGKSLTLAKTQSVTIAATSTTKGMVIALPHSLGVTAIEALLTSTMNLDISAEFVHSTVGVAGAGSAAAVDYDVWTWTPAEMKGSETVKITLK